MTTLLLARHGETDWTRDRRWQGHGDPPLNARGREQAAELAQKLADVPIAAIYASDLRRTAETAAAVAAVKGLEVHLDPALRETDFGDWTGLTREEVERRFPEGALLREQGRKGWNGGESYEEMAARVVPAVERIAGDHPDSDVLVIMHNRPIRAVLAFAAGIEYESFWGRSRPPKKGSVSVVACEAGAWRWIEAGIARVTSGIMAYLPLAELSV